MDNLQLEDNPVDLFAFKINYHENETNYFGNPLFNGNISETYWKTSTDNILRKYGYHYDNLNRLRDCIYQKPDTSVPVTNMYDEYLSYDKNGNITALGRNGDLDGDGSTTGAFQIDDLVYTYHDQIKNQLMKVRDMSGVSLGFKDDVNDINDEVDDYTYDDNGNMISDENKGIEFIRYNHLNLPAEIIFGTGDRIQYLYNAIGQKVQKKVTSGGNDMTTDYLDGFQYTNQVLKLFPHVEGYVNVIGEPNGYKFSYVYNYTDHLGNIRVSYGKDPETGVLKILEENHYYPFGLKHTNYNSGKKKFTKAAVSESQSRIAIEPVASAEAMPYKYKYNGKEYQDELNLNLYDYGARNYDPAIGRWMNIDPLAEKMRRHSPYNYCFNNPMRFIDPDGMAPTWIVGEDGQRVTLDSKSKTGYSANMKNSTLQLAQAMQQTEQGKSDFNEMFNSETKAYDIRQNTTNKNAGQFGGISYKTMKDGTPLIEITVFTGTIGTFVKGIKSTNNPIGKAKECNDANPEGGASKEQAQYMIEIAKNNPTTKAILAIGASEVSHEYGHDQNNSHTGVFNTPCEKEILPEQKQDAVLRQTPLN